MRDQRGHQDRSRHSSRKGREERAEEKPPDQFQAVIVLGKNWRRYPPKGAPEDWRLHLSIESKMSALAAGEMHRSGCADTIIFSTGRTAGTRWPSEARAMKNFLMQRYAGIADDAVILEEDSIDTIGNAEEVLKILETLGTEKVALLTVGFHLERSKNIFEKMGIAVVGFSSEEFLCKRSRHYEAFVARFLGSARVKVETVKETILGGILMVDPRGKGLREVTTRLRG